MELARAVRPFGVSWLVTGFECISQPIANGESLCLQAHDHNCGLVRTGGTDAIAGSLH